MTYILVNRGQKNPEEYIKTLLEKVAASKVLRISDYHTLKPEEKDSIGITEVKTFIKEMIYKPFESDIQIGVILEAEKLTTEAQNSLLKILEESPEHTIFILCVNNERNLLQTIRSRGSVVYTENRLEQPGKNEDEEEDFFFELDMIEKFAVIEKQSETKDSATDLVNRIEAVLGRRLELEIKNGNIESSRRFREQIRIAQACREKISANCNRRLALEAMVLELFT